jgi:hypothetical protein
MCVCSQLPLSGRLWVGGCGLARCLLSISDSVLSTPVNQRAAQRDGDLLPTLGLESAFDALGLTSCANFVVSGVSNSLPGLLAHQPPHTFYLSRL